MRIRDVHLPFAARLVGPLTIGLLLLVNAGIWLAAAPAGQSTGSYVGQAIGAEAVLLLSISLVLISTLPWVEQWFDGIDRAAIWHRRVAITGLVLLLPHVLLSKSGHSSSFGPKLGFLGAVGLIGLAAWAILPRWRSVVPGVLRPLIAGAHDFPVVREVRRILGGYERWRALHRTTGVFVAAGFLHGVLDGTPFNESAALRWSYVAIGATGLAFYVYRELFARFFRALHDYQVESVTPIGEDTVEIALKPLGQPMRFVAGQFAMVYLEAKDGWHRHPFTIASAPTEPTLRVTVKALGDHTSSVRDTVEAGMPAVIGGPHGRFDYARGTRRQAWIAGGIGVAPFLSWLRSLDGSLAYDVDFFLSSDGASPFAEEIRAIAAGHDSLRVHLVDTRVDGRLTPERVLAVAGGRLHELSVFMCGPTGMLRAFQTGLRSAGVPGWRVHHEYFDWR